MATYSSTFAWKSLQTEEPGMLQSMGSKRVGHEGTSLVAQTVKHLSAMLQCRRPGFKPWVGEIPWRRKWQSIPVLLPGKSHGQRSLVGLQSMGSQRVGHD